MEPHVNDSFNANYYIVSATVIPLFYVALILQGSLAEDLERMNKKIGQYVDKRIKNSERYSSKLTNKAYGLRNVSMALVWSFIGFIAFGLSALAILAGLAAEGLSLWSLLYESDSSWIRNLIFLSMVVLLIAMGVRPLLKIYRATWVNWRD
jgi:hypothetical protein